MNAFSPRLAHCSLTGVFLLTLATSALAQAAPAAGPSKTASAPVPPRPASKDAVSQLAWNELTPSEQQALKPLASNWGKLSEGQKRKWRALASNYGAMSPQEQATLHSRMTEWAALSPKDRTQARLNFAETKKLPQEEKLSQWEAYQQLSPEERARLAASASKRPPGAATAIKPTPPALLAVPPQSKPPRAAASAKTATTSAAAASARRPVDQHTLLPIKPASGAK